MDEAYSSAQEQDGKSSFEQYSQLEQQLTSQSYTIQEQNRKIEALEEQLAEANLLLTQLPQINEKFSNFKDEIRQIVEQQSNGSSSNNRTTPESMLNTQFNNYTKALNDLRRDIDRIQRQDDQILLARSDNERLNKMLTVLESRLDTLSNTFSEKQRFAEYVEEQRQNETQRFIEIQQEVPKIRQSVEESFDKVKKIEQQLPQFSKYDVALENIRQEMRHHREHMDFQMAQRERLLKSWTELAEEQERRFKSHADLMDKYAENYQQSKRALATLQEVQERFQREQHQAEELQRLTENRQRTALEKLQLDYEQQWQKRMLELQPRLDVLENENASLKDDIASLQKSNKVIEHQINLILQIIEEDIQARASSTQDWLNRFEQIASEQS